MYTVFVPYSPSYTPFPSSSPLSLPTAPLPLPKDLFHPPVLEEKQKKEKKK
jgi:hypothetical protein